MSRAVFPGSFLATIVRPNQNHGHYCGPKVQQGDSPTVSQTSSFSIDKDILIEREETCWSRGKAMVMGPADDGMSIDKSKVSCDLSWKKMVSCGWPNKSFKFKQTIWLCASIITKSSYLHSKRDFMLHDSTRLLSNYERVRLGCVCRLVLLFPFSCLVPVCSETTVY